MAVGKEDRSPFWVDGRLMLRLRGLGPEPGRIIRVRRPFALIGQIPGADIRIDDPDVDGRHALLLLDRRGIFGVDLLSRTGTRFAGAEVGSAWLGPGDILEVAGRRVELLQARVDGITIDPPLCDDDLLGDAPGLVGLTLEPLDVVAPPWMLGSALAFVGRGDACALRIENASASRTHCALLRGATSAHVIDLLGRRTLVNDRAVEGASELLDGDVLTVGRARFAARLDAPTNQYFQNISAKAFSLPFTSAGGPGVVGHAGPGSRDESIQVKTSIDGPDRGTALARTAPGPGPARDPRESAVARLIEGVGSGYDSSNHQIIDVLRQFQADAATLLEAQIDRIESLNREVASLRDEIRGHLGPPVEPAEPLRLDLVPPPAGPPGEAASWLLDRLHALEAEGQSTWKGLLGKIAATVSPRPAAQPAKSLHPIRPPSDRGLSTGNAQDRS